jgi:hypothetical protein
MSEEGIKKGDIMTLSMKGKKLSLKFGISSNRTNRPKKRGVFSKRDALELKAELDLGHNATNKVKRGKGAGDGGRKK